MLHVTFMNSPKQTVYLYSLLFVPEYLGRLYKRIVVEAEPLAYCIYFFVTLATPICLLFLSAIALQLPRVSILPAPRSS